MWEGRQRKCEACGQPQKHGGICRACKALVEEDEGWVGPNLEREAHIPLYRWRAERQLPLFEEAPCRSREGITNSRPS